MDLLNGWAHDRGNGQGFTTKAHIAMVGTVYALVAHTHKLGYAVLELLNAGFTIEIIPLVRAGYESALTASWIAQVPDALPAYLNRNHSQQKALRDTIYKAGWMAGNQVIPADELEPYLVSGPSKNGASYVVKLCADFLGGDGMYGLYRGLSWMTHPTAAVTDYSTWRCGTVRTSPSCTPRPKPATKDRCWSRGSTSSAHPWSGQQGR